MEVTTYVPVILTLCGFAGFGGAVLGFLVALLFGAAREPGLRSSEYTARRHVAQVHRAAREAMMADALRQTSSRRASGPVFPVEGEWYEGHG